MPAFWSGEFPVTAVDADAGTMTVEGDGPAIVMEPAFKAAHVQVVVTMDGVDVPAQPGDTFRVQVRAV